MLYSKSFLTLKSQKRSNHGAAPKVKRLNAKMCPADIVLMTCGRPARKTINVSVVTNGLQQQMSS